jgi:hypothetical protein
MENPNGMLKWFLGKLAFIFEPWEFGDMYTKKTCLWGMFKEPYIQNHIKPQSKKFDSLLMPELEEIRSKELQSIGTLIFRDTKIRQQLRSITPSGFAQAFYKANA